MNIVIRQADVDDISWLCECLKEFSNFYGTELPLFPDSQEQAHSIVQSIISDHIVFVGEIEGARAGFIGAHLGPHLFNPTLTVLSELFWWVLPQYRNSKVGGMLMDEFIEFGRDNADWVTCVLEQKSPVPDEYILAKGFSAQERAFLMEVN